MSSETLSTRGIYDINGSDEDLISFIDSLDDAHAYPTNLVYSHSYTYQLEECRKQLEVNEANLFGNENIVDLLEVDEEHTILKATRIRTISDLEESGICRTLHRKDPLCRFVFISALSSRDRLNVERFMLSRILTWHQVMPEVVEFMLAFGISEHSKDFLYSGFRSEMNLSNDCNRLMLCDLGRSGREIRLCHILRSVERVDAEGGSQTDWPWALRPTVTYHSFDAESGKSVWMIVKANGVIKRRIRSSCEDTGLYQSHSDSTFEHSFESTLRTHLMLCAWASENWRWYINFIEERIQILTREALTEQADASSFKFSDLQHVHFVEEKANETLLVLEANAAVIHELRTFYTNAADPLRAASMDKKPLNLAIAMFRRHLDVMAKDLAMQKARSQMLLKLLADRKSLLASMLQWGTAQSNSQLAARAQTSAENMEAMTEAMHTIANETKMEAANMRIITLVTLFFLPGTFVSVSVALYLVAALGLIRMETLMSTPIVHYPDGEQIINRDALNLFIAIALPLLAVTLVTWYGLYRWHKIKARKAQSCDRIERLRSKLWSDPVLHLKQLCKASSELSIV